MSPAEPPASPIMDLVAGPQGSGKSTFFPAAASGYDAFNVDDRRRELNRGSSQRIPPQVRQRALSDYQAFIERHLRDRRSFSIEVTLAKEITFEQARRARDIGFRIRLTYVGADLERCIQRVANRIDRGGHGVSPTVIRKTYTASLRNLARAIREFDVVQVYDNARQSGPDASDEVAPRLVLEARQGAVTYVVARTPSWLKAALARRSGGRPRLR